MSKYIFILYYLKGAGQSSNNPIPGLHGLNLGPMPVNPALVAAALNQVDNY